MFHTKTRGYFIKGTLGVIALSSTLFATTLADDYLYVSAAHLNVRAAGTYRSAIVATVDNGYKVTVLEVLDNGWKKVLLENGEEGYVNGRYLVDQEPYFEKAQGSLYTVNVYSAYMRAEGLKRKIAVLHRGDRLEVLDEKVFLGKWLRVRVLSSIHGRYNERVGYVSKNLVSVDENSMYVDTVSEDTNPSMDSTQTQDTATQTTEDATTTEDESDAAALQDLGLNSAPAEPAAEDDVGDLLGGLLK